MSGLPDFPVYASRQPDGTFLVGKPLVFRIDRPVTASEIHLMIRALLDVLDHVEPIQ